MVCKIAFCSEFPNIPDNAGRKIRRRKKRRRRTKTIAKHYAFHANAEIERKYTIDLIPLKSFKKGFAFLVRLTLTIP